MKDPRLSRRHLLRASGAGALAAAFGARCNAAADDVRRCYIDSANGDDARDGKTPQTALKSLAAAEAMRPRPTWIGLARGSRFAGTLRLAPGMAVEAYGSGAAPIIDAGLDLRGGEWEEADGKTWAYRARLRQVHRLVVDGRPIAQKARLSPDDPPGSWAWIEGRLRLRSERDPREAFRQITALNRNGVELIGAGNAAVRGVAVVNAVHGFLGQYAQRVVLRDCTARDCARNGFYLADDVSDWDVSGCISEDNGGAGFAFNYGAARSTIRDSRGNRNGVDGCQFSEGCGSESALIGCVFSENAVAGVNCKEKRQKVVRCRMEANGEAGVIAQINTEILEITDSVLAGNNRADNGTMNLALEDRATVVSARNIYIAPEGKTKPTVNVRLIGRSALQSVADCFIDIDRGALLYATIRVASEEPTSLTILHGSFYNAVSRAGRVIDARGAAKLTLSIHNTAIAAAGTCLSYDAAAKVSSGHNCYHNAAGGMLIEVSGAKTRKVVAENLRGFAADMGVERGTIAADPQFVDPEKYDLSLAPRSPARGAGEARTALTDVLAAPFGAPPNIGAVAARGDLRARVSP